jgi:hypothetical protein
MVMHSFFIAFLHLWSFTFTYIIRIACKKIYLCIPCSYTNTCKLHANFWIFFILLFPSLMKCSFLFFLHLTWSSFLIKLQLPYLNKMSTIDSFSHSLPLRSYFLHSIFTIVSSFPTHAHKCHMHIYQVRSNRHYNFTSSIIHYCILSQFKDHVI